MSYDTANLFETKRRHTHIMHFTSVPKWLGGISTLLLPMRVVTTYMCDALVFVAHIYMHTYMCGGGAPTAYIVLSACITYYLLHVLLEHAQASNAQVTVD